MEMRKNTAIMEIIMVKIMDKVAMGTMGMVTMGQIISQESPMQLH
jgi:hypothetical protein